MRNGGGKGSRGWKRMGEGRMGGEGEKKREEERRRGGEEERKEGIERKNHTTQES